MEEKQIKALVILAYAGVATAVLVMLIDMQIKNAIIDEASAARQTVSDARKLIGVIDAARLEMAVSGASPNAFNWFDSFSDDGSRVEMGAMDSAATEEDRDEAADEDTPGIFDG